MYSSVKIKILTLASKWKLKSLRWLQDKSWWTRTFVFYWCQVAAQDL